MENSIEELKQRLEELYQTQQARLDVGADDLDIREEIAEAEDEIKELQADINEKNNNGNDTNVGSIGNSIEEDIEELKRLLYRNELSQYGKRKLIKYYELQEKDYKRVLKENEIYKKNSEIMSKENLSTAEQLKVEIKENFRLKNQLENNRKEYQETYEDIREELGELKKENEELNNRCRNLDKEAQAYLEELAGDNTLTRRTIKQLQEENEELKQDRNNNYQMIALAQNEALGYMQGYEDGKKLKRSAVANIVENQQYYIIKKQIEKYETYIEQLRKELEQKDKIIDLMAETINNYDIDEDVCKQMGQKANCNEYEDAKECKECIKHYFINKAKEIR